VNLDKKTHEIVIKQHSIDDIRRLLKQIELYECGQVSAITWNDQGDVKRKLHAILDDYLDNWGQYRCSKDCACAITDCRNRHPDQALVPKYDHMSNE
jgi:hypothetical protein